MVEGLSFEEEELVVEVQVLADGTFELLVGDRSMHLYFVCYFFVVSDVDSDCF